MEHYLLYLFGPELTWAFVFMVTAMIVSRNQPATDEGNRKLQKTGWFLPWLAVMLSFVPLAWATDVRWIWLIRIAFTGAIGLFLVIGHLCSGINYEDERNSRVGGAYIGYVALGFFSLLLGLVIAAFFIATRWRFVPFLKWGLILLAIIVTTLEIITSIKAAKKAPPEKPADKQAS